MEVLLGMRNYGPAIDIWGIGCIVAELFTGRPILQGGRPDGSDIDNDLDQFIEIAKVRSAVGEISNDIRRNRRDWQHRSGHVWAFLLPPPPSPFLAAVWITGA